MICASAGNHAQGVALAARRRGIAAVIVMPRTTPHIKVQAVLDLGGEVVLEGDDFDHAFEHATAIARERGLTFIHPFDDPDVIAGQGTIGMEILRQCSSPPHAIFVPIGGGGLIAGIATYVKSLYPQVRIVGVEPEDAASMHDSLRAGERVTLDRVGIFADGVAVRRVGEETFRLARKYVDEVLLVTTDEICAAIQDIFEDNRTIAEPAGALAVAGIKRYVAREQCRAGRSSRSTAAPTSTSTACATSPSGPTSARSAKRCWPSRFPRSRAASCASAACSAAAASRSSITATTTRARRASSPAFRWPKASARRKRCWRWWPTRATARST